MNFQAVGMIEVVGILASRVIAANALKLVTMMRKRLAVDVNPNTRVTVITPVIPVIVGHCDITNNRSHGISCAVRPVGEWRTK